MCFRTPPTEHVCARIELFYILFAYEHVNLLLFRFAIDFAAAKFNQFFLRRSEKTAATLSEHRKLSHYPLRKSCKRGMTFASQFVHSIVIVIYR
jgi:hypothetical protein